ncbi:class III poly(R)-hydroxyalkanoic acid synthase subunit PhaE [Stenotrophomonas sp. YIM B06876]|uniref:class III poly(R)-hydroxyalkanoic acid synthase subunit PhaE n=1 Tax=Stenotrophomonas sp. YIM B06876 TaxID=3060211 RepID=UPI0027388DF7|nr:class III poly(R)-hydroxyalkanoic acid synthase subunit PhaE [Stenotrophomonas sp. YIM B06876]
MAAGSSGGTGDFDALIREYWNNWGDALRKGTPADAAAPGAMPWQDSIEKWSQLLGTGNAGGVDDVVRRFRGQAGDWLGTMHQVAAQFAGRDSSSAEVAAAWREAVLGQGDGMLRWMLDAARGGNTLTDQPWIREFSRLLQGGFSESDPWLGAPTFGPAREHQARWQALLKIQQQYKARAEAYVTQIRAVLEDAFQLFEARLGEHETAGSQLTSARALFDLWIDAAEEAYAKVALSEEFRDIYAELANAQMRLRAATQHELEKACESIGVPTRSEMDTAYRKIAELERLVRRMATAAPPDAKPTAPPKVKPATARTKSPPAARAKPSAAKPASPRARKRAPAGGTPK